MLLATILLVAAPVTITTADTTSNARTDESCQQNRIFKVSDQLGRPLIHPLANEPEAQSLYVVVREIDGCNKPIVLNPKVGQPPVR